MSRRASVPSRMRSAALLVLVATSVPATAVADDPGFGWVAPPACPSGNELRARIERRLGGQFEGAIRGLEIAITRESTAFVAKIDARALTVENDIRTLRSRRCDELVDAIAVIVARLAMESASARTRAPAPEPERSLVAMVPPEDIRADDDPTVDAAATVAPPPTLRAAGWRSADWGGGIHVLGVSGVGALPSLNLGGELGVYLRRDDVFAELAFARWATQSAYLQPGAPARVDVGLDVVTTRAGWGPHDLPVRAWAMAEVGSIAGTGAAVEQARMTSSGWYALGGGFGVAWPMSRHTRLIGSVELAIPLRRTTFRLENGAELYQPSPAAARCSFGIEVGIR